MKRVAFELLKFKIKMSYQKAAYTRKQKIDQRTHVITR